MNDPIKLYRLYCTLPGGYTICHSGTGQIPNRDETGIIVQIIRSGIWRGVAKLIIPSMEWLEADGFSNAEMAELKRFVRDNAEIIVERAKSVVDEIEDAKAELVAEELLRDLGATPIYDAKICWVGCDLNGDRLFDSYDYIDYEDFCILDRDEKTQELRNLAAALFFRRHGEAVFSAANGRNVPMWWSTVEVREDETTLYSETLHGEDLLNHIRAISLALCEEMLEESCPDENYQKSIIRIT